MLYQLPNGRTIVITIDRYLSLSDSDIKDLVAGQFGEECNDPFHHSALFDLKGAYADRDVTLNKEDVILLDDLPEADRNELASTIGLQGLFDDGDYFSDED